MQWHTGEKCCPTKKLHSRKSCRFDVKSTTTTASAQQTSAVRDRGATKQAGSMVLAKMSKSNSRLSRIIPTILNENDINQKQHFYKQI